MNMFYRRASKNLNFFRYQSSMEQVPGSAPSERVTVGTKLSRAVKKLVSSDITKVTIIGLHHGDFE